MSESFGDVLKRLRDDRRLSMSRLADMAGFVHSYISRLENGERRPTRESVNRLADALKATIIERIELLAAAGFSPSVSGVMFADPALAKLHAILSSNRLSPQDDQQIRAVLAMAATFAERVA